MCRCRFRLNDYFPHSLQDTPLLAQGTVRDIQHCDRVLGVPDSLIHAVVLGAQVLGNAEACGVV